VDCETRKVERQIETNDQNFGFEGNPQDAFNELPARGQLALMRLSKMARIILQDEEPFRVIFLQVVRMK
jgi:hypothetical protein